MTNSDRPLWWDEDDATIAGILNRWPVTESERLAARQKLLSKISRSVRAPEFTNLSVPAEMEIVGRDLQSTSATPRTELDNSIIELGNSLPRTASRRNWMAVAALASSVVLGLFWWRANSALTTEHLIFVCDRILAQDNQWHSVDNLADRVNVDVVSEALRKYLTVYPKGEMQTCELNRSDIALHGRLWKIPVARGKELYLFVFQSPRDIKNIDSRLKLISGSSHGWSTAAARSDGQLLVFLSRDELTRSLRFMPLA